MRDYAGAASTEEILTLVLTFAMSVIVFALSINFRWSILTFRSLQSINLDKIFLLPGQRGGKGRTYA